LARREVVEYAELFRDTDPEEWKVVAGVLGLSTAEPEEFTESDIVAVYQVIAGDEKVWTIEGSPYLDWDADPEFAAEFCRRWNQGELLP